MALASICGGKILDKLRYIFSQISDSAGIMVHSQFDQFLREVLKLPMAVFEGPSFGYTEQAARACFTQQVRVHSSLNVLFLAKIFIIAELFHILLLGCAFVTYEKMKA
ncbi:hypothetical protein XENOCAPTIV_018687 [Xenoophorus captivus]|uniref:EF-hand domain-containing protein n=1 Tax=Xenoophorus captivus TaxID=1517983 RepID=A0ABV0SH83_9TELE